MKSPAAFHTDENTTLWVMNDIVAVLNSEHAKVVFFYAVNLESLRVYGIKGTTANLLTSYHQALEFFEDQNETLRND